jgi:hypothetical protein
LFENGIVIVSRLTSSNFTVKLPRPMRQVSLSKHPSMLTDQREAPAWQLIIDNEQHGGDGRGRHCRSALFCRSRE